MTKTSLSWRIENISLETPFHPEGFVRANYGKLSKQEHYEKDNRNWQQPRDISKT